MSLPSSSFDNEVLYQPQALPVPASRLGESPFWHPQEAALYWCDIPGKRLNRFCPADGSHRSWHFDQEPGSAAPVEGGGLLLAMRDGLWFFDPASESRRLLAEAPYDPALERFNDGKADPQGRFWVGTIYEPREPALAALYQFANGQLRRVAGGVTTSNGLAWSPDARTQYWTDTKAHEIRAFDFDPSSGEISQGRSFARFVPRQPGEALQTYGGRPDGAAVDQQGAYWVAMYEGQRLLRLSHQGEVLMEVSLPVRCATMPCFGDADWRTLYITTACDKRPPEELAVQPWAGKVLRLRVEVPGLQTAFVRL